MRPEKPVEIRELNANVPSNEKNEEKQQAKKPKALAPGQWMRVVMGFEAPFGHDGMPTVWG
jgi:hypothetical protein